MAASPGKAPAVLEGLRVLKVLRVFKVLEWVTGLSWYRMMAPA
jgi:hypothetical protein